MLRDNNLKFTVYLLLIAVHFGNCGYNKWMLKQLCCRRSVQTSLWSGTCQGYKLVTTDLEEATGARQASRKALSCVSRGRSEQLCISRSVVKGCTEFPAAIFRTPLAKCYYTMKWCKNNTEMKLVNSQ